MKALTISQPFASAIARGEKWVENRKRHVDYRGPLAIHAGKGRQYLGTEDLAKYPTGVVLAVCELVCCVPIELVRRAYDQGRQFAALQAVGISTTAFMQHIHTEGPYCLVLRNVRRIEPVKAVGSLGLWDWNYEPIYLDRQGN